MGLRGLLRRCVQLRRVGVGQRAVAGGGALGEGTQGVLRRAADEGAGAGVRAVGAAGLARAQGAYPPQKDQEAVPFTAVSTARTTRSATPRPSPSRARNRSGVPRRRATTARTIAIGPRTMLRTSSPTSPRTNEATAMPSVSRRPVRREGGAVSRIV